MNLKEFEAIFPLRQTLIGTDMAGDQYLKFYDNGSQVGLWRYNRITGEKMGQILSAGDAQEARQQFSRVRVR